MVCPDDTAETFAPSIGTGGQDAPGETLALRYQSWAHAARGTSYTIDFALMLRGSDGTVEVVHDRHIFGLFSCAAWSSAFIRAGFHAPQVRSDQWRQHVFLAQARGLHEKARHIKVRSDQC